MSGNKKGPAFPVGFYHGHVSGRLRFLNHIWTGKTFTDDRVVNKVFGHDWFEGGVTGHDGLVFIYYPRLHLTDVLAADGVNWRGSMKLGFLTIRFTLQP